MNILKNLFGGSRKTKQQESSTEVLPLTTVMEAPQENIPPVDLFIDNEVPQLERKTTMETQNKITVFLNRNYHSMGTSDGYEYHSQETLETAMKKIRAEFQLIVDQSIQEKFTSRLQIKHLIVDVANISEEAKQKLENTIEEINSSLALLQEQKELSAVSEGWVMNAVHSYHQGFVQGLNDYISGENLLNSIKNI